MAYGSDTQIYTLKTTQSTMLEVVITAKIGSFLKLQGLFYKNYTYIPTTAIAYNI